MGLLGWPPAQFWAASMHDLGAAIEGWNVGQGDGKWREEADGPKYSQLREDFEDFKKHWNAKQRR